MNKLQSKGLAAADFHSFQTLEQLLKGWPRIRSRGISEKILAILPYVVLWCIWQTRNGVAQNCGDGEVYDLSMA
ncbi:hypothetical protein AQUCO_10700001v1 [Aquilegia coerulea]|uniref:Uncharacterized protein n=1 Tax=Aquilegia coerulea TaxID=218851 RepID=A0A2G5C3K1_AQUCA|nr:hypothetical protein AQUCO_10700001v1 [Aquilegia coerulea]